MKKIKRKLKLHKTWKWYEIKISVSIDKFYWIQPCCYILSMAAFWLQWQSWVSCSETVYDITLHCCLAHYKLQGYSYNLTGFECYLYCYSTIFFCFFTNMYICHVKTKGIKGNWTINVTLLRHSEVWIVIKLDGKTVFIM